MCSNMHFGISKLSKMLKRLYKLCSGGGAANVPLYSWEPPETSFFTISFHVFAGYNPRRPGCCEEDMKWII